MGREAPRDGSVAAPPRKRLLAIASAGGHWIELERVSPAFEDFDALYVTTAKGSTAPSGNRDVIVVRDASRWSPLRSVRVAFQVFAILSKFKPHFVVTTGALPGLVAIFASHFFDTRTVWIDSIANSEKLSLSGRIARPHADLCLTQWSHLVDDYPGVEFYGTVL